MNTADIPVSLLQHRQVMVIFLYCSGLYLNHDINKLSQWLLASDQF